MTLQLYHHNSSVCAAKVRVALAEKGLDWESKLLRLDGDQFDPEYLALNPNAVVPTLVHNGRAIIESTVILEYLEDAFPEHPLRPSDPYVSARARRLMARLDAGATSIHFATSVLTYAIAYRHHLIEEAGGEDRARLAEAMRRNMNEKSRRWLEDVVYEGVHAPVVHRCLKAFDTLLGEFELYLSQMDWLTGDAYSISDVSFTSYMIRLELLQLDLLWSARPALTEWYARIKSRPSAEEVFGWYEPKYLETLTNRGQASRGDIEALLVKGDPDD